MGQALFQEFQLARTTFEEVSDATGQDVQHICFALPEDELRNTDNAQLALFTCGVAAHRVMVEHGSRPQAFAGHSIGEYAALVAAGTLSLADGARLVKRRGELMAAAGSKAPGTMAAVLGLGTSVVAEVLAKVDGIVVIANDNCPGQVVISGEVSAVESASPLLSEAGARRVLPLSVSGAFHSPLMVEASKQLATDLASASFEPSAPVISNVTTQTVTDPNQWPALLETQLRDSVRWTESIQNMIGLGVTEFVECGVGEVLCGLIKRIDKEVTTYAAYDPDSIAKICG